MSSKTKKKRNIPQKLKKAVLDRNYRKELARFLVVFSWHKIYFGIINLTRRGIFLKIRAYAKENYYLRSIYLFLRLPLNLIQLLPQAVLLNNSGLFSKAYYEEQTRRRYINKWHATFDFLIKNGRRYAPHPLFDTQKYLEVYPALKEYYHIPVIHYLSHGFREMYVPHPVFDTRYYCSQPWYADVTDISPLQHYLENARTNLDINPNKYFITRDYVRQNPEYHESKLTPLEHWLARGETLLPSFDISRDAFYAGKKEWDAILVTHEASRTGAPLVVLHLVKHLQKSFGYRCLVISERGGALEEDYLEHADLVVLEHHWEKSSCGKDVARLLKEHITNFPAHIIVNSAESYRSMEAFYLLKVPFVLLMHEFGDLYPEWYLQNIVKWPNHIVYPAEVVKNSTEEKLKIKLEHYTIKPQGYPFQDFTEEQYLASRQAVRSELEIPEESIIFLGCGCIDERKGCDYFVDVAAQLAKYDFNLPYVFIWIGDTLGSSISNAYMQDLKKTMTRKKINEIVHFIGSRTEIQKYFRAADIFLLTSRLDPFPYVVMHAMEAAIPVLCFEGTTGVDKLFADGKAGFAVKKFNTKAMAEKLKLLSESKELRIEAGLAAKELLEKHFSYADYVQHIFALCEYNKGSEVYYEKK